MFVTNQAVVNSIAGSDIFCSVVERHDHGYIVTDGYDKWLADGNKLRVATIDEALKTSAVKTRIIQSELFGPLNEQNRFKLQKVLTRFGIIQWFVFDANIVDGHGFASVILQENNKHMAITKAMLLTSKYDTEDVYQ